MKKCTLKQAEGRDVGRWREEQKGNPHSCFSMIENINFVIDQITFAMKVWFQSPTIWLQNSRNKQSNEDEILWVKGQISDM